MAHMAKISSFGTEVNSNYNTQEMLTKAGLNWRVQKRQLAMSPIVDGMVDRAHMLTTPLEDFRAITRSSDSHVFQIAKKGYQPMQNEQIVDFFREFCEAGHASIEDIGSLKNGAVVWALAQLNNTSLDLGGGDGVLGKLLMATSHDASIITTGKPTQIRPICMNTLRAALRDGEADRIFRLKHTTKFDDQQKDEAKRIMGCAIEQVQELNSIAAELAKVTIDHTGWMEFMTKLMGEELIDKKTADLSRTGLAIQEATMTSPGSNLSTAKGTLWGAVNGVTYYADHTARSRSESNRLFSSWFGQGEKLKASALEVAVDMAGIR